MTIPKYDEIRLPALQYLAKQDVVRLKDFERPLAKHFSLSEEEISLMYESGNGYVFYDRLSWALSEVNAAGLVDKPKRGYYKINDDGLKAISEPEAFEEFVKTKLKEASKKKNTAIKGEQVTDNENELTPQEQLYQSYSDIRRKVYDDILDTIISKSPYEFEHLVVKLLEKMGYGGQVRDAGTVTSASNDGGIDGIIKEDVLGLGRIHIQAKRYKKDNTVGREAIQNFVGALAVAQSNKGIFITTSSYTKGAHEYASNLNGATTLVLIDGLELAKYIYDYNLGMQVEQVIEIKKLDSDYWDSLKDDN
ncbi:restriction endonuclease [Endozoicomonas sp. G2_1]|uniref:restriction endonuclease n=1 Tax=Endozoicomonas sp. G2_1 TaxID=2821091 RepID=UPI001ADC41DD|nr:restriction endonuclease [Endozoicomonas sp. G2_1]MBO9491425.1 restriction endonuclease [Endozoicomonas sp. G2_1]